MEFWFHLWKLHHFCSLELLLLDKLLVFNLDAILKKIIEARYCFTNVLPIFKERNRFANFFSLV